MRIVFKKVVVILLFSIEFSCSSMIDLTQKWIPNAGWEVDCLWTLVENDELQSVRLYNNGQQFFIYRPEINGTSKSEYYRTRAWDVRCRETSEKGVTGACVVSAELIKPPQDFNFTCEVSGERPTFRIETKSILVSASVPPSDAHISVATMDSESGRVTLNCTSSGLPSPTLIWTIGAQRVPPDFSSSAWNYTTKVYDAWSAVSYSWADAGLPATCTPETHRRGRTTPAAPAQYSGARGGAGERDLVALVLAVAALL